MLEISKALTPALQQIHERAIFNGSEVKNVLVFTSTRLST